MGFLEDLAAEIDASAMRWMDLALCQETDPEIFYPTPGGGLFGVIADAKRVCRSCEVRAECLEYALGHMTYIPGLGIRGAGSFGIWGATTEPERRRILAARQREAA